MAVDADVDRVYATTEAFVHWLQHHPGTRVNPKIQIADLRHINAGRGIVAVQDIEDDEELFSIPQSVVLTAENSSFSEVLPEILDRLDSWNALILVMIYEHGLAEHSPWWHYLNILPSHFDTLIYWSPSELAELQGSAVVDKIGRDAANDSFIRSLLPIVQKHPSVFGRHAQGFAGPNATLGLLELAHRMATLIMAYGFDLEPEPSSDEDEREDQDGSSQNIYELHKGMVPLADLLNADGNLNNAHLVQDEAFMTMIALKPIKQGEQIFNDFGQLPRSDLLRRYGYVTERYKQYDVVEIPINTVIQVAAQHTSLAKHDEKKRLQLAADWEVLEDGFDLARPSNNTAVEFDQDLQLTTMALLLNQEEFEKAASATTAPERPPSSMLMTLYLVLKEIVAQRMNAYSTTIAEDIELLRNPMLHRRHRMAVEVRLGEKEILSMASESLDQKIAKYEKPYQEEPKDTQSKKRKF